MTKEQFYSSDYKKTVHHSASRTEFSSECGPLELVTWYQSCATWKTPIFTHFIQVEVPFSYAITQVVSIVVNQISVHQLNCALNGSLTSVNSINTLCAKKHFHHSFDYSLQIIYVLKLAFLLLVSRIKALGWIRVIWDTE